MRADYCLNSMPTHLVVGLRHKPARSVRAGAVRPPGGAVSSSWRSRPGAASGKTSRFYGGDLLDQPGHHPESGTPPHGIHARTGVILGAYAFDDGPGRRLTRLSPAQRIQAALAQGEKVHPGYRQLVERGISVAWVPDEPRAGVLDPLDRRGDARPFRDAAEPHRPALYGGRSDQLPPGMAGRAPSSRPTMPCGTSSGGSGRREPPADSPW